MNEQSVRKFLLEEYPHYLTDAGVSMLRTANSLEELRTMTITAGRDGRLPINAEYEAAVREHFSIYAFEDYHGESSRQRIYAEKKAKDEKAETAKLLTELKNVRIVNQQGERLDVLTLPLPQLRQHKADIKNHKRMKGMSASDLRAEYIAKHPTPERRADGYPTMPQQMVVPAGVRVGDQVSDGIRATVMSPEVVYRLGRAPSNSAEYHYYRFRLVRAYGAGQVTERQQVSIPIGAGEGQ